VIVTAVPPVIGPEAEGLPVTLIPVTVGVTGDQSQLSTTILAPQYTTHSAVVGALIPGG
jgi:putative Ca2+/H+ antiporter (TMEM165/GDT1 family)